MALDRFVDQYIASVTKEISDRRIILETKDFKSKSDFARVQGQLQGFTQALELLRAVPEDD